MTKVLLIFHLLLIQLKAILADYIRKTNNINIGIICIANDILNTKNMCWIQ